MDLLEQVKHMRLATPEIVEKYKNTIGCIIKPALREGIIIYGEDSLEQVKK